MYRSLPLKAKPAAAASRSALTLSLPLYVLIGMCAGAVRIPLVRATPINWDGVQFELALSHFDLHAHQPHPPGYILYVLAGRALTFVTGDGGIALSLLSVLACAVAVPLVGWLALQIFGETSIALGAALLVAASPLTLYYGAVGLTYAPEMALSLVVAVVAWKGAMRLSPGTAVLLGAALGLSGGFRQTSLLMLLPLCLWALRGASRTVYVVFIASLVSSCALWVVPLLILSGGPAAYLRESALLAGVVSQHTSIFGAGADGVLYNLAFEAEALGVGLAFGVIPLGLWALRLVRFSLAGRVRGFFLCWILPATIFFAVSHMGQYGYVLVVLPPLMLLSALCVRVLLERLAANRHVEAVALALCAAIALPAVCYFALAEGPVTASNIVGNDARWSAVRSELGRMAAGHTVIVTNIDWDGPFRAAGYLLPAFHAYAPGEDPDKRFGWLYSAYGGRSTYALPHPHALGYLALPPGTRTIVALDKATADRFAAPYGPRSVTLRGGSQLYILDSPTGDITGIDIRGDTLLVRADGAQ